MDNTILDKGVCAVLNQIVCDLCPKAQLYDYSRGDLMYLDEDRNVRSVHEDMPLGEVELVGGQPSIHNILFALSEVNGEVECTMKKGAPTWDIVVTGKGGITDIIEWLSDEDLWGQKYLVKKQILAHLIPSEITTPKNVLSSNN